jgi:hypothetical protein
LTATGGYILAAGQTLAGAGTVAGDLVVAGNSFVAPGNSPGAMSFLSNMTMGADGNYIWEINDATGTAGNDPGWDLLSISGQLSIASTVSNPFVIDINSLTIANVPGTLSVLPNSLYSWTIATAGLGITGFNSNLFQLNTGDFNANQIGTFSIVQNGNNLVLMFQSIPEPTSVGLLGLGMLLLVSRRRSR